MPLRRSYHRLLGHQQRFLVAAILTIVLVAFLVVPWVAAILEGLGTYGPGTYEPKDFRRGELQRRLTDPQNWTAEHVVNIGIFVLLAVVWYLSVGGGGPRGSAR